MWRLGKKCRTINIRSISTDLSNLNFEKSNVGSSSGGTSSSSSNTLSLSSVNHENFKNVYQLSTANENRAEFYSILPDFIVTGEGWQTETLYFHSISSRKYISLSISIN